MLPRVINIYFVASRATISVKKYSFISSPLISNTSIILAVSLLVKSNALFNFLENALVEIPISSAKTYW